MNTTDTDALTERIARALFLSERWGWNDPRPDREKTPEGDREQREKMAALWDAEAGKPWHESRWPSFRQEYPRLAAAVLPIIAAEVQAAKAEALREMQEHHEREADKAQTITARGIHLAIADGARKRATDYESGDQA